MFERFTDRSRRVVVVARDLAVELDSGSIHTGHLLYACALEGDTSTTAPLRAAGITGTGIRRLLPRGAAAPAADPREIDADSLREIGIDLAEVQAAVESTFGTGALESAPDRRTTTKAPLRLPFTRPLKATIGEALAVARELKSDRILPGHLLLGLLRVGDPFVLDVLRRAEASLDDLTAAVLTELEHPQQWPA